MKRFTLITAVVLTACLIALPVLAADTGLAEKSTLQAILKAGKLRVGMEPGYMPFEMQNKESKVVGFDVDMARLMAKAMGVESYRYKVLAFCISSGYAGLAGAFYASWTTLFSPDAFTLTDSIMISVMETLGGIGSLEGIIPGAIIIGALPELLRPITTGPKIASLRLAAVGLLMVIMLIIRPEGIAGMSIRKAYISLEPVHRLFAGRKANVHKHQEL